MDAPKIFQFVGSLLDNAMNAYVDAMSSNVIAMFSLFAVLGTTIYLLTKGYLITIGIIEQPAKDFFVTCMKLSVISSFALTSDTYSQWAVEGIRSLGTGMASAFSGTNSDTTSIYQTIDQNLGKGWAIAGDLWEQAGTRGIDEIGMAIGDYFNAIIIALSTGLIGLPAGGTVVISNAGLNLVLGIGPVFIMALMWPVSARFFDGWFSQVMTYITKMTLPSAVLGLAFKGFEKIIQKVDISLQSTQNDFFTALILICYSLLMLWLLKEANRIAGQLAGGISSEAITLRKIADKVPKLERVRNTQPGAQPGTENSRQNAITRANPAYRQHVMENLNKWSKTG